MPRLAAILLLSTSCVACAGVGGGSPAIRPDVELQLGGRARVLVESGVEAATLGSALVERGFVAVGDGSYAAVSSAQADGTTPRARRPRLDVVDVSERGVDDPLLLLSLGRVDAALVRGDDAARIVGDGRFVVRPAPSWDRDYFLWFAARGRWLRDVRVRASLAALADPRSMAAFLFGGRAAPIGSVLDPTGTTIEPDLASSTAVDLRAARLTIVHPADDRFAAMIAARLRAALDVVGVDARIRAVDAPTGDGEDLIVVGSRRGAGADAAALSGALRPFSDDPGARRALERIDGAEGLSPALQADAARLAEHELRVAVRLVPLVRLPAELAAGPDLVLPAGAPADDLGLSRAWRRP